MGENLSKFIESYGKKISDRLKIHEANLEKFNSTRDAALSLITPVNVDGVEMKLGELVAGMIPDTGIVVKEKYDKYVKLKPKLSEEDKKIIGDLIAQRDAPQAYKKTTDLQEQGGQGTFDKIINSLNTYVIDLQKINPNRTVNDLLGYGTELDKTNFKEIIKQIVETNNIPVPGGIIGETLYTAIKEHYESPSAAGSKSPINEESNKKEGSVTAEASALNPEKAGASIVKTEVESTVGQVTSAPPEVPVELEKKEEKTPININLGTPPSSKPSEPTSITTNVVNQGATNETANISNAINSTETFVTTNVEKKTEIRKEELTQTAGSIPTSESPVAPTASQINETKTNSATSITSQVFELFKKFKTGEEKLKELLPSSPINSEKTELNVSNNLEKTELSSSMTPINEEEAGEKIEKTPQAGISSSINEKKVASDQDKIKELAIQKVSKMFGINSEGLKETAKVGSQAATGESVSAEQVSSESSAIPQQMEVSKTQQTLPQETTSISSNSTTQLASTEVQPGAPPIAATEATAPTQSMQSSPGESTSTSTVGKVGIDVTGLENRLMRIEHLLSNTLEVKIVD